MVFLMCSINVFFYITKGFGQIKLYTKKALFSIISLIADKHTFNALLFSLFYLD